MSLRYTNHMMKQGAQRILLHLLCILSSVLSSLSLISCSIEPPLRLPVQNVRFDRQAVEVRVDVIWENPSWGYEFLYGWEEADIAAFGPAEYVKPEDYELRLYFLGERADAPHTRVAQGIMHKDHFRSLFNYGYHDILAWSNIHTDDNTQAVLINESLASVDATVTRNNSAPALGSHLRNYLSSSQATIYNQPEVFYSAYLQNLHITPDPNDYDFYDEASQCWVKQADMPGAPLVYIYLLQVVLRNNDGRIKGVNTGAAMTGITDSVNVNYGTTSQHYTSLLFDLGIKHNRVVDEGYLRRHHSGFQSQCQLGEKVDVLGGRITTYGLCGMKGFLQERSSKYAGQCPDNQNLVAIDFMFKNDADSIVTFDISNQLKNTCHGGVLTIEFDASDIPIPSNPHGGGSGGSGFDPYIENYRDTTITEIPM